MKPAPPVTRQRDPFSEAADSGNWNVEDMLEWFCWVGRLRNQCDCSCPGRMMQAVAKFEQVFTIEKVFLGVISGSGET